MSPSLDEFFKHIHDNLTSLKGSFGVRLIERSWQSAPDEDLNDFTELNESPGWKSLEHSDLCTCDDGRSYQVVLSAPLRALKLPVWKEWRAVSKLAGDELNRRGGPLRGVSMWVWAMARARGVVPCDSRFVDSELVFRATEVERSSGDSSELREAIYRHGKEWICTKAIRDSIMFASWLTLNDWQIGDMESPSKIVPNSGSTPIASGIGAGSSEPEIERLKEPLSTNDQYILQAMLEVGASSNTTPIASAEVLSRAGVKESGTVWSNLRNNGLVDAKPGVGRWLTAKGKFHAEGLIELKSAQSPH